MYHMNAGILLCKSIAHIAALIRRTIINEPQFDIRFRLAED